MPATVDAAAVRAEVARVADGFAVDRSARQQRRYLERADFDLLAEAGFLLTGVPREQGGIWSSVAESTRDVCEILRALARGDSSVALVSSMHPAVLGFWLTTPDVPEPDRAAWSAQRKEVFEAAVAGKWFGTITSEPGSGGDVRKTKAVARRASDGGYALTGAKHFGSGSGITSFMLTSALPEGEDEPDWFYLPVEDVPWDGSAGIELTGEWDGHGMAATQSHALKFDSLPAVRFAWPGHLDDIIGASAPVSATLFTAVVTGIVDVAVASARAYLEPRQESLRAYERTEWAQAEMEAWLAVQAYEGILRAIETGERALGAVLRGKTAAAQLAESCLLRICRVIGGGTFSQRSPFGWWFEDVRALGFLRPPWGLAADGLFAESFQPPPAV
jgi:alkylation response protein AidB-like acyl-CoA dehydrogenase